MATYRFRLVDRHGQLIGVHYLSFYSDAEAIRHADTAVGEYDCGHVEVLAGDKLIFTATQRLR
jgi:hypothetical protein